MASNVRIVVADDHAILRSGLKLLLTKQENWDVVAEASTGQQTLAIIQQTQADVLLLDLSMPDGDGLSVLGEIRAIAPAMKILVLTMHEDEGYLRRAMRLGANGYILKKAIDTELIMAIQAILRNEMFVHSAMTQFLLATHDTQADAAQADPWQELSEREYDVLKRVALGYTNSEIADELFLSTKTVETYRARGMEKLGVETRAQLVRSAMENQHLE